MKPPPVPAHAALLQLLSVPVVNEAATQRPTPGDTLHLTVPLQQPVWAQALRFLLPFSREKNAELDRFGAEIFAWCDGTRTVEEIIDLHKARWQLSFFESRAMILQFLELLMRHGFLAMIAPPADELAERLAKPHIHPPEQP